MIVYIILFIDLKLIVYIDIWRYVVFELKLYVDVASEYLGNSDILMYLSS